MITRPEPVAIGGRLRNALIADMVEEADIDEADRLLIRGVGNDERDWTEHLARQLGFETRNWREAEAAGLHDTLMVLIPELDRMLRHWPPNPDGPECLILAQAATQGMTHLEVYATLLTGSASWRHATVEACRVDNLAQHLRTTITRALANDMSSMLQRWIRWDVLRLRERWREAKDRAAMVAAEEQAEARERARLAAEGPAKAGPRRRKRIPPPPGWSPPGSDYPGPKPPAGKV